MMNNHLIIYTWIYYFSSTYKLTKILFLDFFGNTFLHAWGKVVKPKPDRVVQPG